MKKTGVYAIRCMVNGKVYVGSAARSFQERWTHHRKKLRGNYHENSYLQATWNKLGEAAFEFSVLEECLPCDCVIREQFWIDELKAAKRDTGFNLSPTAGNCLGVKHTEETRKKLSLVLKGRKLPPFSEAHRKALSEAHKGKMPSQAAREAISKANKGKKRSEAIRKTMSEAQKGRKHSDETRKKLSERVITQEWRDACSRARKGKKLSEEHRRKISERQTGKPLSPEHRKAVSDGLKGRKRTFNEAWRKAMSESRKGKPKSQEHVRKIIETKRNKRLAREAMSQQSQLSLHFGSDDEA